MVGGCATEGQPLYWAERCLSFGVQGDGSETQHINWQTADEVIRAAFSAWLLANCGGGAHPSIQMWDLDEIAGPMVCDHPEYNKHSPNANVWMFRDHDWPYPGENNTLALTTITFDPPTGRILDADVEINSFKVELTVSTDHPVDDLQSIATHEAGHFLGLGHSLAKGATMNASYNPRTTDFRTLSADDVAGICAIYPPDRDAPACSFPEPNHGFSRYCGNESDPGAPGGSGAPARACSLTPGRAEPGGQSARPLATLSAVLLLGALRRARRSNPVKGKPAC
jgi:hypothetical protein